MNSFERLRHRVQTAASKISLFPLVREIAAMLGAAALGDDADASHERLLFSHAPRFSLAGGELLDIVAAEIADDVSVTVQTALLGLIGTESPLPPDMGEDVLFDDTGVLQAFYDVFHHRALTLLYRAWLRFEPSTALERLVPDDFTRALLSFIGHDDFSPYSSEPTGDSLAVLGLSDFARGDPASLDERSLGLLLERTFPELHPRVTSAGAERVSASESDRNSLGTGRVTLSRDSHYGSTALDESGVVRIIVGPVGRCAYERLRPGGEDYLELLRFSETWLLGRFRVELEVQLTEVDAPRLQLGEKYGSRLGVDAQYRAPGATSVLVRYQVTRREADARASYEPTSSAPHATVSADSSDNGLPELDLSREMGRALKLLGETPISHLLHERGIDVDSDTLKNVDALVCAIDSVLGQLVDDVLHDPDVQRIEASWRGLAYLVHQTARDENTVVSVLDCSKQSLALDLETSSELSRSRIFGHVYSTEFGTFGGRPYAAILGDFTLDMTPAALRIFRGMCAIGTVAHAPLFASASPRLLGLGAAWGDLSRVQAAATIFEGVAFDDWNRFRDDGDSRVGGIVVGRPLYRAPHSSGATTAFDYEETIAADGAGLLFGNGVFVLGARLAASFSRHRTLAGILGDDEDACPAPATLSFHTLGKRYTSAPLEVTVTPRLERALSAAGLIPLVHGTDGPRIFLASANSVHRPERFSVARSGDASLNEFLSSKFPYLLLAFRFAHYVKVLERELVGAHRSAAEVETHLNEWLSRYVIQMNGASDTMRSQYPLRGGSVSVRTVDGFPDLLRGEILVRPHLRFLDQLFTLSVGSWIGMNGTANPPLQLLR